MAMRLNVLGMDNCFEAERLCGVQRVVYASSVAVNGQQHQYGERLVSEDDPTYGNNQYAMHKIFNEGQARDYLGKYGMSIMGVRPANVTGPDKVRRSVNHVRCITEPARGRPLTLPYRDFIRLPIHVDDIAEVFARVLLADAPRSHIYNSGGTPISLGELADMVQELLPDAHIAFEHQEGGKHDRAPIWWTTAACSTSLRSTIAPSASACWRSSTRSVARGGCHPSPGGTTVPGYRSTGQQRGEDPSVIRLARCHHQRGGRVSDVHLARRAQGTGGGPVDLCALLWEAGKKWGSSGSLALFLLPGACVKPARPVAEGAA
jgi:NAD dependent epimerase/dehydratase family